jgi:Spy/CpxP family protein refolding chaperone
MNFFTKIRATSWIIGLLVILNLLTLSTIWFQQFRRPPQTPPSQENRSETVQLFLQRELNLTDQQAQQFTTLRTQYLATSRVLMQDVMALRKTLTEEMFATSPDTPKADQIAEQIGVKHAEVERLLFSHLLELKAVCEPEQQAKFQRLMQEILDMMKSGDQPRPQEQSRPPEAQRSGPPQQPENQPPRPGQPQQPGVQPRSDARDDQRPGNPPGGSPQQPPREAINACEGKQSGAACTFVTLRNETKTGTCEMVQNLLACVPQAPLPPQN